MRFPRQHAKDGHRRPVTRQILSASVGRSPAKAASCPQRQRLISGISSPYRVMYCLCSMSLSRIACLVATPLRLVNDENRFDPIQVMRIALLTPVTDAGDAKRGNPVEPERVAVGFPLDQHHKSSAARIGEMVKAVEAGFAARFPTEAITFKPNAKPDSYLFATGSIIRDAHRWPAFICQLRQPPRFQKINRQGYRARVIIERHSDRLGAPKRPHRDAGLSSAVRHMVARLRGF